MTHLNRKIRSLFADRKVSLNTYLGCQWGARISILWKIQTFQIFSILYWNEKLGRLKKHLSRLFFW